ncbi:hypothetical protein B0T26DRAFT_755956 [Lasiosphaeria miniovina]|uniref:Uncharacterized protein n=1 Tax=Lasiosphaeria miniovina TaxID=1954250 RepID=A0AA39ZZI6_9PEZI|nr:uncharacterized protein B0T26DRAFT_755956 [Lasiosphaeria miniovina]KAK0706455.1 hypothetical protein B0T26DRAFT_755956 [Lasiosphaeria miniovina]
MGSGREHAPAIQLLLPLGEKPRTAATPGRGGGPAETSKPRGGRAAAAQAHFDADELSRRLYVVLAEQKAHAERKRRARAEAAVSSSRRDGSGGTTRHDAGRSSDGATATQQQHKQPAEAPPPTNLISDLRQSQAAKRKSQVADVGQFSDAAAAGETPEYHHVPREAAKQFARTTTVEVMRENSGVHQLSGRALKFHMDGQRTIRAVAPETTATGGGGGGGSDPLMPSELNRALKHSQTQRDRVLDRNQFQRTRTLEEAAQLEQEQRRDEALRNRHTFEGELSRIAPEGSSGRKHHHRHQHSQSQPQSLAGGANNNARRNNMGGTAVIELLADGGDGAGTGSRRSVLMLDAAVVDAVSDETPPDDEPQLGQFPAHEHRVDWTQSDEGSKTRPKLLLTPLLRKADSLWGMRGRLGSGSGKGGPQPPSPSATATAPTAVSQVKTQRGSPAKSSPAQEKNSTISAATTALATTATTTTSTTQLRSPKSSFFAKFKR